MIILLDLDSTLADSSKAFYDFYVEQTGDNSKPYDESKITWNMNELCSKYNQEQADNVYIQEGFFKHLKLYPDVCEILTKLKDEGNFLHVVSCHKPEGMVYKMNWIQENLPMIDKTTLIPIEHGNVKFDKSMVLGTVLIDDKPDALLSSKAPYKICYSEYPWNKEWQGLRAYDWNEVYKYIKSISVTQVNTELYKLYYYNED